MSTLLDEEWRREQSQPVYSSVGTQAPEHTAYEAKAGQTEFQWDDGYQDPRSYIGGPRIPTPMIMDIKTGISTPDPNYRTAFQQVTAQPIPQNNNWFSGSKPTSSEALARIYEISKTDQEKGKTLFNQFLQFQDDPSSPFYAPYSRATNPAIAQMAALGYDVSNINDQWYTNNAWLMNYYRTSDSTGSPLAPTKTSSKEQNAAYWMYKIQQDEETTRKAETEWKALQEELRYWAWRSDRNYSDAEIIDKINWSNYPTLKAMDDGASKGVPLSLNRAVGYSQDNLAGVLWAYRNGTTGTYQSDSAKARLGEGKVWEENPEIRKRLDPTSADYNPYVVSSTLDDAAQYFGTNGFDQKWLDEHAAYKASTDATQQKMYQKVYNAEQLTVKIEKEIDDLYAEVNERLKYSSNADDILDGLYDDFATLNKLEESLKTGDLLTTTRAVGYNRQALEQAVREQCDKYNSLPESQEYMRQAMNILGKVMSMAEEDDGTVATRDQRIEKAAKTIMEKGTDAEKKALQYAYNVMHEQNTAKLAEANREAAAALQAKKNTSGTQVLDPNQNVIRTKSNVSDLISRMASSLDNYAAVDLVGNYLPASQVYHEHKALTERKAAVEQEIMNLINRIDLPGSEGSANHITVPYSVGDFTKDEEVPYNTDSRGVLRIPDEEELKKSPKYLAGLRAEERGTFTRKTNDISGQKGEAATDDAPKPQKPEPNAASSLEGATDLEAPQRPQPVSLDNDMSALNATTDSTNPEKPQKQEPQVNALEGLSGATDIENSAVKPETREEATQETPDEAIAEYISQPPRYTFADFKPENLTPEQTEALGPEGVEELAELQQELEEIDASLEQMQPEYDAAKQTIEDIKAADDTTKWVVRNGWLYREDEAPDIPEADLFDQQMDAAQVIEFYGNEFRSTERLPDSVYSIVMNAYGDQSLTREQAAAYARQNLSDIAEERRMINDALAKRKAFEDQMRAQPFTANYRGLTDDQQKNIDRELARLDHEEKAAKYFLLTTNEDFQSVVDQTVGDLSENRNSFSDEAKVIARYTGSEAYVPENRDLLKFGNLVKTTSESTSIYAEMTAEEAKTYMYLLGTQGQEAASQYFKYLNDNDYGVLTTRHGQNQINFWSSFTEEHPIAGSVISVAMTPYKLAGGFETAWAAITGGEINPYSANFIPGQAQGAIRSTTKEKINEYFEVPEGENPGWFTPAWFANLGYDVAMSGGDSAISAVTFGNALSGLGGSSTVAQSILGALPMGFGAAGDTAAEIVKRGGSPEQVAAMAGITLLAETFSEAISFNQLTKRIEGTEGSLRQAVVEAVTDALGEGAGEALNEVVEGKGDEWIMGEKSERETLIKELVASGVSQEEAERQADAQFWNNVLYAGATGLASSASRSLPSIARGLRTGAITRGDTSTPAVANLPTAETTDTAATEAEAAEEENTLRPAGEALPAPEAMPEEANTLRPAGDELLKPEPTTNNISETMPETPAEETANIEKPEKPAPKVNNVSETTETSEATEDNANIVKPATPEPKTNNISETTKAESTEGNTNIEKPATPEPKTNAVSETPTTQEGNTDNIAKPEKAEQPDADKAKKLAQVSEVMPKVTSLTAALKADEASQTNALSAALLPNGADGLLDKHAALASSLNLADMAGGTDVAVRWLRNALRAAADNNINLRDLTTAIHMGTLGGENAQTPNVLSRMLPQGKVGRVTTSRLNSLISAMQADLNNPEVLQNMQKTIRDSAVAQQVNKLIADGGLKDVEPKEKAVKTAKMTEQMAKHSLAKQQKTLSSIKDSLTQASTEFQQNPGSNDLMQTVEALTNDFMKQKTVVSEYEQAYSKAQQKTLTATQDLSTARDDAMALLRKQAAEMVDEAYAQEEAARNEQAIYEREQAYRTEVSNFLNTNPSQELTGEAYVAANYANLDDATRQQYAEIYDKMKRDAQLRSVFEGLQKQAAEPSATAETAVPENPTITAPETTTPVQAVPAAEAEQQAAPEVKPVTPAATETVEQKAPNTGKTIQGLRVAAAKDATAKATNKKVTNSPYRTAKNLAKALGVGDYIATKKMPSKLLGLYDTWAKAVKVGPKEAGNYTATMHELGHAIAQKVGMTGTDDMVAALRPEFKDAYDAKELPDEAFGEFMHTYLANRDAAVDYAGEAFVDTFEYKLRKAGLYKDVQTASDELRAYLNASVDDRLGSVIVSHGEQPHTELKQMYNDAISKMVDRTAAANPVSQLIRKQSGKRKISLSEDIQQNALMMGHSSTYSGEIIYGNMQDANHTIVGDGLAKRWEKSGFKVTKQSLEDLAKYRLAKQTIARRAQGKEVLDARTTDDELNTYIAQHKELQTANQVLSDWWYEFMQRWMVDEHLMSQKELDHFKELYPDYAPTLRVKDKTAGAGMRSGDRLDGSNIIKEATGSTEDIYNPIETMFAKVEQIVNFAMQNRVARAFDNAYNHYEGMGIFGTDVTPEDKKVSYDPSKLREDVEMRLEASVDGDLVDTILDAIGAAVDRSTFRNLSASARGNVIKVIREDGTAVYYEIKQPELYKLLAGVSDKQSNYVMDALGRVTRAMSMLTTGSNPIFAVRNAARDFQSSVNYGTWATSYLDGAYKWGKAFFQVMTKSGKYQEYQAMGGGGWTRFDTSSERSIAQTMREFKGYKTSSAGEKVKTVGRGIWKTITAAHLNEWVEQTSRAVEYMYGKHDLTTVEGRTEAFQASQDVTVDFSRRGSSATAAQMRKIIPFLNASVQGVYRTGRQLTEAERGDAPRRFAKTVINTALTSAACVFALMNAMSPEEKKDYENMSDDMKAQNFFLPNPAPEIFGDAPLLRIPIGQDPLMYAVNGLMSNAVWNGTDDGVLIDLAAVANTILDNLNPVGSTIFEPLLGVSRNQNWYGSRIIPSRLENRHPSLQYTDDTPEVFKAIGRMFNVSPLNVQYLAEQYTGYLGQLAIPALSKDKHTGKIGGVEAAIAAARKRLTSDPLVSQNIVSAFYDGATELKHVQDAGTNGLPMNMLDYRLTEEEGSAAFEEADAMLKKGGVIFDTKDFITKSYNKIDAYNADPGLTDQEKYELTSAVRREMIEAALTANEAIGEYKAKYITGENPFVRMLSEGMKVHVKTDYEKLDPEIQNQPYMQKVKTVWEATGEKTVLPQPATTFSASKVEYKQTDYPSQWGIYTQTYYDAYSANVTALVNGETKYNEKEWSAMSDAEKADAIKSIRTKANNAAKDAFLVAIGVKTKKSK